MEPAGYQGKQNPFPFDKYFGKSNTGGVGLVLVKIKDSPRPGPVKRRAWPGADPCEVQGSWLSGGLSESTMKARVNIEGSKATRHQRGHECEARSGKSKLRAALIPRTSTTLVLNFVRFATSDRTWWLGCFWLSKITDCQSAPLSRRSGAIGAKLCRRS